MRRRLQRLLGLGGTLIALGTWLSAPAGVLAQTYTVKPGETLTEIADAFDMSVADLAKLNHLSDPDRIHVGERLVINVDAPETYVVKPGDTLSIIAGRYGLTVEELAALNDIADPDAISPGTPLLVQPRALTHTVKPGETLSAIALDYGSTVTELERWNGISDPRALYVGEQLSVAPLATYHIVQRGDSIWSIAQDAGVTVSSLEKANHLSDAALLKIGMRLVIPPVGGGEFALLHDNPAGRGGSVPGGFAWPLTGPITSGFGYRWNKTEFHEGIDIAASMGTKIHAAASGVVTYATWAGTYGQLVVIEHPLGYQTRYAHMSKILVKQGQQVHAGDVIGLVGATGHATGPHLHFEVRLNGRAENPLSFLPPR